MAGVDAGLVVQLAAVFMPIVMDLVKRHQAAHPGSLPTDEELLAAFQANVDKYLAEGKSWSDAHPRPPS